MSEHQTGPRCRRIAHKKNTPFQAVILPLLHTHNALGLGLHRQPSYNHYTRDGLVSTKGVTGVKNLHFQFLHRCVNEEA